MNDKSSKGMRTRAVTTVAALALGCLAACGKTESKAADPPAEPAKPAAAKPGEPAKAAPPAHADSKPAAADGSPAAFFEGAPPADVKLTKPLGKSPQIKLPDGWSGNDNLYSGMLYATHPSGAQIFHHAVGPGAVSNANRDFWIRAPLSAPSVKWDADVPAKLGAAGTAGTASKGAGKCGKNDADFYAFRYVEKGAGYMIVACLPKSADASMRAQAEAIARSATLLRSANSRKPPGRPGRHGSSALWRAIGLCYRLRDPLPVHAFVLAPAT